MLASATENTTSVSPAAVEVEAPPLKVTVKSAVTARSPVSASVMLWSAEMEKVNGSLSAMVKTVVPPLMMVAVPPPVMPAGAMVTWKVSSDSLTVSSTMASVIVPRRWPAAMVMEPELASVKSTPAPVTVASLSDVEGVTATL